MSDAATGVPEDITTNEKVKGKGTVNDAVTILTLAQNMSDQLVSEARTKVEEMNRNAKAQAEELIQAAESRRDEILSSTDDEKRAAQAEADQIRSEAVDNGAAIIAKAHKESDSILAQFSSRRNVLRNEIARLQSFEERYRSELKDILTRAADTLNHYTLSPENEQQELPLADEDEALPDDPVAEAEAPAETEEPGTVEAETTTETPAEAVEEVPEVETPADETDSVPDETETADKVE